MKNFKNDYPGGMPLNLDDFRWVQAGQKDRFEALISNLILPPNEQFASPPANSMVIYGVKVTGSSNNRSWTSGVVMLGGELYTLDAGSGTQSYPSTALFILPDISSYDANGSKTYGNGITRNTYEIKKAKVVELPIWDGTSIIVQNELELGTKKRLFEGLHCKHNLAGVNNISSGFSATANVIKLIRQSSGEVSFVGSIACGSNASGLAFTIPPEAATSEEQSFIISNVDYQGYGQSYGRCVVNGINVYIYPPNGVNFAGDEVLNLSSIRLVYG